MKYKRIRPPECHSTHSLYHFRCNEHSAVDHKGIAKGIRYCQLVIASNARALFSFSSQQVMFGNLQSSVSWHDSTSSNEVISLRQNFKVPIRIAFFLCTINGKWRIHQHRHKSWAAFTCICLGWNWYVWWCFIFSRTSATSTQNNWVIGTSFSLVRCI